MSLGKTGAGCFTVLLLLASYAGSSSAAHEITPWPNKNKGAVSLTFDDGCASHQSLGIPALDARGLKGTFFVITNKVAGDWDPWRNASVTGHEIGSHTKSHPYLTTLTPAQVQDEMGGANAIINANIPSQKCLSFAWPYGDLNSEVEAIAQSNYIAARGVYCGINLEPFDFYSVSACAPESEDIYAYTDLAETEGGWGVFFFHSLNGGQDCSGSYQINLLAAYLDYLKNKNLWVETFGTVAKYIKERTSSTLSVLSSTSSQIVLSLTDTLDDSIYDEPLTIRSEVPAGWTSVTVQQGSSTTTVTSTVEGAATVIYYGAVPDRGSFSLAKSGSPGNQAPAVTTNAATAVTSSGATMNGGVNPNGQATTAWFEWGTSPTLTTFSSTSNQSMGSGASSQPASAALSGLSPGTIYYFRVAASNAAGTTKGSIASFIIPGGTASGTRVWLPATSGALSGKMAVGTDYALNSLAGTLVYPNTTEWNTDNHTQADVVAYTVNIPAAGTWYFWSRMYYPGTTTQPTNDPNSFWVSIDGGAAKSLGNRTDIDRSWHWEGAAGSLLSLGNLSMGNHTLRIWNREARELAGSKLSPRLDVLFLTSESGYTPNDVDAAKALAPAPTATTNAATSVTTTGATLNGGVNPNGVATTAWFEWGASPTLATFSSTSNQSMGSGASSQPASATLSSLSPGTMYYFRAAASNAAGTVKGSILSFSTTAVAPTVTTNAATSVTTTGATLNGGVNPNGVATTAWFEWGTSPTLATFSVTPNQSTGSGTASQAASAALSGLSPGTTYYFRVAASNAAGAVKGSILSFSTTIPLPPPSATTSAATSVTSGGGTLNGGVNPNGVSTTAWFEWGTSPTLSTFSVTANQAMGSGTSSQGASAALSSLSPGTTYYFRAAASNAGGTAKGSILTFSTAAVAPTATTNAATSVTFGGATLNGGVNPNGAATTAWFEWGTSPTLATFSVTPNQSMGSGTSSQGASAAVSGLSPVTTYYFRAAASNAAGTAKGSIVSFTTSDIHIASPPYPPSLIIKAITWASSSTIIRQAQNSDNWPVTWGADDNLYTAYGDGYGFDPKIPEKLSLGFAVIYGSPPAFSGVNFRSPTGEQTGDGEAGKKASGMLMMDNVLFMWVRNAGNSQLAWSSDYGRTWTWSTWKFTTSFAFPTFLNFGKNYAGARDEYVYVYSPDNDNAYVPADRMVLARVPKGTITIRAAYEFFNGLDASGNPVWTADIAQRQAVFTFPGNSYRSSISYHAASGRYLWVQTLPGGDSFLGGGFGVYEAPEPWGPWTTAYFTDQWDVAPGEMGSFPTKWMSDDGMTLYMVFSGNDSFSVRMATLTLDVPASSPPTATTNAATSVTTGGATLNGGVNPNGAATTAWFEWGTSSTLATFSSTSNQSRGSGTTSQPASAALSSLSPGTTYYFRMAASNAGGTVKGSILSFSTTAVVPTATTNPATSVTSDGATLNGSVNPNGAATTAWFEWGTSPTLATFSVTANQLMGSGTASQAASAALSGLSTGTPYYFRVAASNAAGTTKGSILSFGTSALAPTVATNAATSVTASGATANGGVNPNGAATTAWFEWGTSSTLSTFSSTSNQSMGSGTTSQPASAALSGLTSGTTYYFRVAASNAAGTAKGSIAGFTVLGGTAPSTRVWIPAASGTLSGMMSNGTDYSANSLAGTLIYPNTTEWNTDNHTQADAATYTVGIPAAGTWYLWARMYYPGTTVQPTNDPNSFWVSIDGGAAKSLGNRTDIDRTWHWEGAAGSLLSLGNLSAGNHTLRVWNREARETGGSKLSPRMDVLFLTSEAGYTPNDTDAATALAPAPTATTTAATSVTASGGTLNGSVNPNGAATTAWFEWGTSSTLATFSVTSNQSMGSGTASQGASAALSGLTPGTTYYFRVAASNAAGTTKGSILTFSTPTPLLAPTVATNAATSVTASGATANGGVNPNGAATTAWFEWGTSPTLSTFSVTPNQAMGSGTTSQGASAALSGLSPGTTLLLPCGGFERRGDDEGLDPQLHHLHTASAAVGYDERGHLRDGDRRHVERGGEPERCRDDRVVRMGDQPDPVHLQRHSQPGDGIRDVEPGGERGAVGAEPRDHVLLPCGGFECRWNGEGIDSQFQHGGRTGPDGDDERGHLRDDRRGDVERGSEPERRGDDRVVRVGHQPDPVDLQRHGQPGDGVRDVEPGGERGAVGAEPRDDVLLPCGGFECRWNGEGIDSQFQHGGRTGPDGDDERGHFRDDRRGNVERGGEPERCRDDRVVRMGDRSDPGHLQRYAQPVDGFRDDEPVGQRSVVGIDLRDDALLPGGGFQRRGDDEGIDPKFHHHGLFSSPKGNHERGHFRDDRRGNVECGGEPEPPVDDRVVRVGHQPDPGDLQFNAQPVDGFRVDEPGGQRSVVGVEPRDDVLLPGGGIQLRRDREGIDPQLYHHKSFTGTDCVHESGQLDNNQQQHAERGGEPERCGDDRVVRMGDQPNPVHLQFHAQPVPGVRDVEPAGERGAVGVEPRDDVLLPGGGFECRRNGEGIDPQLCNYRYFHVQLGGSNS